MKTFTAKVEIPGQGPRFIPNCVIYKGKLAQVYQKGVGKPHEVGGMYNGEGDVWEEYDKYEETYKALINSTLLEENGLIKEEVQELLKKDQAIAFSDERIFKCLFVMGENPNGYVVYNQTEIDDERQAETERKADEAYADKSAKIDFSDGVFGYRILQRLPDYIWRLVKPFATYHRGDEGDEEDADDMGYNIDNSTLKGWFYTEKAIQALIDSGYKVSYLHNEISNISELPGIVKKRREEEKRFYNAERAYEEAAQSLRKTVRTMFNNGEYITEEDCKAVSELPEILFPAIGIDGANIYGGGQWLHEDSDYLYIVQNNGADGDDWSRNNYRTGGAGAIAVRVKKTEDVIAFLKNAEEFENKSVEDYLK